MSAADTLVPRLTADELAMLARNAQVPTAMEQVVMPTPISPVSGGRTTTV